jgi:type VI secretion system protein VasI
MNRYATLRLRHDEQPAQKTRMDLSTDGQAVCFRKAIPTIKKMLQHDKLLVEVTPYSRGPQVTTFDLTGLDAVIEPLQTACHWR